MGSSSGLSLDFNASFASMMMVGFLRDIYGIGDCRKRLAKLEEYVKCLEEERRKIDGFKRELPLCMQLLNDVIEAMKNQCRNYNESSRPVLEEFIPVKSKLDEDGWAKMEKNTSDKMNWMSSAQLWSNSTNDHGNNNSLSSKKLLSSDVKEKEKEGYQILGENPFLGCDYDKGAGTFFPFKEFSGKKAEEVAAPVPDLSLLSPGIKIPNDESGGAGSKLKSGTKDMPPPTATDQSKSQPPRKVRRCWSPELHRQFVNALQQLGGSQVATPKQIRELMQVDGLTNDEVKSHLQKYRLHTRRLPVSGPAVPHQPLLLVGGVWAPPNNLQSSKQLSSHSGSPQSPLQLSGTAQITSAAGGDSGEDEEERSEFCIWRNHLKKTGIEETVMGTAV